MIYVECNPDELLVREVTGVHRREIGHENGKFEISKRLQRSSAPARALVDEDPGRHQGGYLERLGILQGSPSREGLKVLDDARHGHRVVVLCPRLEEWIVAAADQAQLRVQDFGLPTNPTRLHDVIVDELQKLANLLLELRRQRSTWLAALHGALT